MKHCMIRAFIAICLASVMLGSLTVPASASEPDYRGEIEAMSKWLDGLTLTPSSGAAAEPKKLLTGEELTGYADTVYNLVNRERERAGLALLERDSLLDEAAMMESTNNNTTQNNYQVGNTLYQVTPVFREASGAEHIADKIERLILRDQEDKSAAT